MNDKNVYKYSLILSRDMYIDLENFEHLHKSKRTFKIFQWKPGREVVKWHWPKSEGDEARKEVNTISTWCPFLFYDGKKWRDISKSTKYWKHQSSSKVMLPAHRFFKTEEEFKEWLTPELYNKLFIDLL